MVVSPVPAVDQHPKSIRPHNNTGVVPNTPLGKRSRKPPVLYVEAGIESSTSPLPLLNTPSPLRKRMALLDNKPHDFIGDCVCQLVGTLQWYGNIISSRMYDEKTKLWTVRYDNTDTEEKSLKQVILLKKR